MNKLYEVTSFFMRLPNAVENLFLWQNLFVDTLSASYRKLFSKIIDYFMLYKKIVQKNI